MDGIMEGVLSTFKVTRDGIGYRVTLFLDTDANPNDADCYTSEDVKAWRNDEWCYVTVKVAALIPGYDVSETDDYLGSVEYAPLGYAGFSGVTLDDDYMRDVHPVPEMIDVVRQALARLRDSEQPSVQDHLRTLDLP